MVDIIVDCNNDPLLFFVEQNGPACHLGEGFLFSQETEEVHLTTHFFLPGSDPLETTFNYLSE